MGRLSWFPILRNSHFFYQLRSRLVFVLLFFVLIVQQHLHFAYQEALAAKYSPTKFPPHFTEQYTQPRILDEESAHLQDRLIANRAAWRTLGRGWEGTTFVYQDSVIKTFTPKRSPFRNCARGTANEKWPTEIPASLYFYGFEHNATSLHNGLLPVRAYFIASSSTRQSEWHLVTPLLKGGNLMDLAAKEQKEQRNHQEIDRLHRPAFERLLCAMQKLHQAGYCHDDIKPGNIFVADNLHWVLGDLGNLRQLSHPYHTSRLWKENHQLEDCRANDVFRALKSYVRFVRDSAANSDAFNSEFLNGSGTLARLFWSAAENASILNAADLRRDSMMKRQQQRTDGGTDTGYTVSTKSRTWLNRFFGRLGQQHAVNQAVQTRMGEKLARWWAMTSLFGVPISRCSND